MPFLKKYGTRAQVMNGTVEMTTGRLRKEDLIMKDGRIRSKLKSKAMATNNGRPNFIKALTEARKKTNIYKTDTGKMILPKKNPSAINTKGGILYAAAQRIFSQMKLNYQKKKSK